MTTLDILKRHNAYIARRRQLKSSQFSLSDDEITKNNLEDLEENTNSVSCISHLSVDEIEMQQLKDDKIPLFTSKPVGETMDIITRQALWLEKKELRIKDTLKKQEEEFMKDLSFNPDFGNNTYSWERAKKQSELAQERFVQRERQRESKRELYRLQEELISQTTIFGGLNTSSAILLNPIDPATITAAAAIKKKKKKKPQQQQQQSDEDFIINMTNQSQQMFQDYLAPLSAPEMHKDSSSPTPLIVSSSQSPEKRHNRSTMRNNNNNNTDSSSSAIISSPYYSRSQRNPPKKSINTNDFADLDEFQIDLKSFNKMGAGVHSITQKDITNAQHWFAKLMRERNEIDSLTDDVTNDIYDQQHQQQQQSLTTETAALPLIPKRKKSKPGHKKRKQQVSTSSMTKTNNNNNGSSNNANGNSNSNSNHKTSTMMSSLNNNQPETNNNNSANNRNQYNQSSQLLFENNDNDNDNNTNEVQINDDDDDTNTLKQQEALLSQEGDEGNEYYNNDDDEEEDDDEYGGDGIHKNRNTADSTSSSSSFFHESSSTAEKGRHQVLEPLAFDSSTITRRIDTQNAYVSFLVGYLRDSMNTITTNNSNSNSKKFEIITIVFDKSQFSESSAEQWWRVNEQRVRKDIER